MESFVSFVEATNNPPQLMKTPNVPHRESEVSACVAELSSLFSESSFVTLFQRKLEIIKGGELKAEALDSHWGGLAHRVRGLTG